MDGKDDLGLRVCVNSWDIMPHDGTDELGLGRFGGNEEGTPRISALSEQFRSHRQKRNKLKNLPSKFCMVSPCFTACIWLCEPPPAFADSSFSKSN